MDNDFLLNSDIAKTLYNEYAKDLPIIDYHNHLSIKDLYEDKQFSDIAELWLVCDPYKHRAMRMCGVDEEYITGHKSNKEKFLKWCEIFPRLVGNPLYHWSLAELERIFGIDLPPSKENAEKIWSASNECLGDKEFSARQILKKFNVEYAAPCAALTDDLSLFSFDSSVSPSLRGDDIIKPGKSLVSELERITGIRISCLDDYKAALNKRIDDFTAAGCSFSDHALDNDFKYFKDDRKNNERFNAILNGDLLSEADYGFISSEILRTLGDIYAKNKYTMQLHIGAQRFTSSRLRKIAGAAGGFAGIGSISDITALTDLLDDIEMQKHGLPYIVLFTLNPADNACMSVLSGSYSKNHVKGLVQQGPAWWWCDHLLGMREVFETVSSYSLISNFIGMTTDSRSLLSFVRHDYFRRAFCGWLGEKAECKEFPDSTALLGEIVKDVCYNNARERLSIKL